jgi:hypothetical protein|uniref:Uncharacterized protein n=1 Tax=Myoviridae sp. ct96L1 TaxID=2826623 RepID=A0A8S5N2S8_9CAUD|nr:MAG TPA: hypothetical protein [Myoviridae sp. ct96L1]
MFTVLCWKEIIKKIRIVRKTYPTYYRLKEDKIETTLCCIVVVVATPLFLLIDLFVLPFELIYLITYKILWGSKE